jgi:hypothetical protein
MVEKLKAVDAKVLEMLVCPVTKETLCYQPETQELISKGAGLAYPIRDGIPIMLVDEARPLNTTTPKNKDTSQLIEQL